MTDTEVLPNVTADDKTWELAAWLGRREAFGVVASRCSAADVECLKTIRERKLYKSKSDRWSEFCERYLGFSRTYVDRLIQQLEEFGPNYFHISQMMRISAGSYRAIAGAVREDAIEFGEEKIPIRAEHSQRIVGAVNSLIKAREAAKETPRKAGTKRKTAPDQAAPPTPRQRMERLRKQLDRYVSEFSAIARDRLDDLDRTRLAALLEDSSKRLSLLIESLR